MTAAASAHSTTHVDVGSIEGLICDHRDGQVSIRVTGGLGSQLWLHGTPEQLHDFASEVHRWANRAARKLVRPAAPDVVGDAPVVLPRVDEEVAA